ncbi:MAG: hypothetical protein ACJ8J0_24655, partial [Longimicrobiaceae bacterium]
VLTPAERRAWRALDGPPRARREWLLARAAAKDAVRLLLEPVLGERLHPADVEIDVAADGRALARGSWMARARGAPTIALSVTDGAAVAVASRSSAPTTPDAPLATAGGAATLCRERS